MNRKEKYHNTKQEKKRNGEGGKCKKKENGKRENNDKEREISNNFFLVRENLNFRKIFKHGYSYKNREKKKKKE